MTPADLLGEYELFLQPLSAPAQLSDVELAAVRAGISIDWDHVRFEAQR